MRTLLITGDRSGCGKTSITLAISAILAKRMPVQTYKVGMDYIDPSYLTGVTGRPCRNLDSYVLDDEGLRGVYAHASAGAGIGIIEGVRGLYEGADILGDTGSTASVAKALGVNVILVINAKSITRSAAAIVKGFMAFDPAVRIRGVILNNVSGGRHLEKAKGAIEHFCGVPVIGAVPHTPQMELAMRHLGLVPYREGSEQDDFREKIAVITRVIEEYIDIDALLSIAAEPAHHGTPHPAFDQIHPIDLRIGVAHDEAFNFYYADLFDLLRAGGAEPVFFSPIHDRLPDADGYIIGGGYPELYSAELERNDTMRQAIAEVVENNTPVYAECGGLMYLTRSITRKAGFQGSEEAKTHTMCGVFPGDTLIPSSRVLGYVEGRSLAGPMGMAAFRGHEFHYSEIRMDAGAEYAFHLTRGRGIADGNDGILLKNALGSYAHLHPVASSDMIRSFLSACRDQSTKQN
ncbi:cobyrinic acid a,c-diamide synthase [Methanocalculus chunghsingensis]|uniref:Cobyrinate a,c-diamide synthase n=1 Tax=Methanocalculus chunghsingensis TaxID=156457 RepID=A0A8J7WB16_9EURY|nr:Ni-sirohydrochlorin a,c-diamide synthase [Methanocalculus chunghsingensis]MBR1369412.1 cobyrinic acid a,c-diamide synthase [Methanocalculus chunghsingensis]